MPKTIDAKKTRLQKELQPMDSAKLIQACIMCISKLKRTIHKNFY
jgi:hypothetical protein